MKEFCDRLSACRWGVVVLYLLLCGLYFLPIEAPYKLVYPLLLLTVVSLWGRNHLLTVALGFSALGDFCGASGALLLQIGAFAVAQVCYLLSIVRQTSQQPPRKVLLASIVPVALCAVAFVDILPAVDFWGIKAGVVVYALLIGAMATFATLHHSWGVRIGAYLFVLSDFMLAHLIFVSPNEKLLEVSLALYFAGQLLLWLGLQRKA